MLTYDDCPEIRRLYRGWAAIRPFSLRYAPPSGERGGGTHYSQVDAIADESDISRTYMVTIR